MMACVRKDTFEKESLFFFFLVLVREGERLPNGRVDVNVVERSCVRAGRAGAGAS